MSAGYMKIFSPDPNLGLLAGAGSAIQKSAQAADTGAAAVLAGHEYWLLGGRVLANSQPLAGATLTLQDERDSIIKVRTTDERGRFLLPLKYEELKTKPDAEKPARLLVKAKGYDDEPRELDSFPNIHLTVSLQKNTSHP